jgi:hypothetical protein
MYLGRGLNKAYFVSVSLLRTHTHTHTQTHTRTHGYVMRDVAPNPLDLFWWNWQGNPNSAFYVTVRSSIRNSCEAALHKTRFTEKFMTSQLFQKRAFKFEFKNSKKVKNFHKLKDCIEYLIVHKTTQFCRLVNWNLSCC